MRDGLYLTQDWPLEDILPYGAEITGYMKKLVEKFPQDSTLKSLMHDITNGSLFLWLCFDEDVLKGIVLTQIKTVPATNYKSALISGLAGEGELTLCKHIGKIEEWAWDNECDDVQPVGRVGWKKIIGEMGYEVERVIYSKKRPEA